MLLPDITTKIVFYLHLALAVANLDNHVYTGCGFEDLQGQPSMFKFCNAYGHCMKSWCGADKVFSKSDCGCVLAVHKANKLNMPTTNSANSSYLKSSASSRSRNLTFQFVVSAYVGAAERVLEAPAEIHQNNQPQKPQENNPTQLFVELASLTILPTSTISLNNFVNDIGQGSEIISQYLQPVQNYPVELQPSTTYFVNMFSDDSVFQSSMNTPSIYSEGFQLKSLEILIPDDPQLESLSDAPENIPPFQPDFSESLLSNSEFLEPISELSSEYTNERLITPSLQINLESVISREHFLGDLQEQMYTESDYSPTVTLDFHSNTITYNNTILEGDAVEELMERKNFSNFDENLSNQLTPSSIVNELSSCESGQLTTTELTVDFGSMFSTYLTEISQNTSSVASDTTVDDTSSFSLNDSVGAIEYISPSSISPDAVITSHMLYPGLVSIDPSSLEYRTEESSSNVSSTANGRLVCAPEVNISGMNDRELLIGQSTIGAVYIGVRDLHQQNSSLLFKGSSLLWIPFYQSISFSAGITISLKVEEDVSRQVAQGLVNNCGNDVTPSISIVLDPATLTIRFKAVVISYHHQDPSLETLDISVSYEPGSMKLVEMECNGRTLIGRVGSHKAEVHLATGSTIDLNTGSYAIASRVTPIYVGKGCQQENTENFQGEIQNILIHRCATIT